MPINKDIYMRLKRLINHYTGANVTRFAAAIGQKPNTFLDYLKPDGQHKVKISMIYDILDKFPDVNPQWLLLGEGEMQGEVAQAPVIPPEELNAALSPAQREMLTYKRTMLELGASPERIIDGIEAIAMGKTTHPKSGTAYSTAEPPANPGYHKVHELGADFGENI